jgi:PKD repeat protein
MRPSNIFFIGLVMIFFLVLTCTVLAEENVLTASFTANITSGTVPLTVQFNDTSTGNITAWQWYFDDNTENVTERNPVHTFTATKNYQVILTIYNSSENSTESSSTYRDIIVSAVTPVPTVTSTPRPNNTTPTPTKKPTPTVKPTAKPTLKNATITPTPVPTLAPTETPGPTPEPVVVTVTPEPTPVPLPSMEPTETPPGPDNTSIAIVAFMAFNVIAAAVAGCVYFLFFRK